MHTHVSISARNAPRCYSPIRHRSVYTSSLHGLVTGVVPVHGELPIGILELTKPIPDRVSAQRFISRV